MAKKKRRKPATAHTQRAKPIDPRIRQARVTADGAGALTGDVLVALSVAELPGVGEVWFHETLVPYMLLLDARDDERRAVQALARAQKSRKPRADGKVGITDSRAIVEAQRLGTLTCILSMASIEAFAAEVLPEDAAYEPTKGRSAGKALDRDGIQWLTVEERFGDALPAVLGVPSIKQQQAIWAPFKRALAIRNAAIHPSNADLHSMGRINPKRLSSRILAGEFVGVSAMAQAVMEHFAPGYGANLDSR